MALQKKIITSGEPEENSVITYDPEQSQSKTVGVGTAFRNKRQQGIARPKGRGHG